jgi:hypothetical protein
VRGFLSSPTGWMGLLVVEILGLTAVMRGIVRVFPDLSSTTIWIVAGVLVVAAASVNYVIRRRYLSEDDGTGGD